MTVTSTDISVADLEAFRGRDISSWFQSLGQEELFSAVEISSGRIRTALERLKGLYHGKDTLIDLLAIAAVSGEPLLVLGPPGTGKSDLIARWCGLLGLRGETGMPRDGERDISSTC